MQAGSLEGQNPSNKEMFAGAFGPCTPARGRPRRGAIRWTGGALKQERGPAAAGIRFAQRKSSPSVLSALSVDQMRVSLSAQYCSRITRLSVLPAALRGNSSTITTRDSFW